VPVEATADVSNTPASKYVVITIARSDGRGPEAGNE
jgi:hypothetical protein